MTSDQFEFVINKRCNLKVAPYMTARKLVTNLVGNQLIIGEKYDVTCVKMPKNEHKYRKSSFCEFA